MITCTDSGGKPHGVTVNSFSSVSLDPPLILFSLDRAASTFEHLTAASHFAVNILADDQTEVSRNFARTPGDRWSGVEFRSWDTGAPILAGALAALECDMHAQHDGGDHVIVVGRVRRLASRSEVMPLIYFRGRYCSLRDPD